MLRVYVRKHRVGVGENGGLEPNFFLEGQDKLYYIVKVPEVLHITNKILKDQENPLHK